MKKTKKGFTLIELLIAIACSTIVFLTLSSSMYFISVMNNKALSNSSINYNIVKTKNYIITNELVDESKFSFSEFNKDLLYEGKKISSGVEIIGVQITKEPEGEDYFIYCTIYYLGSNDIDKSLKFIVK